MTVREPLSIRLGRETHELHRSAERTRAMAALLRGTLPLGGYVLMLRNLHEVYAALESSLAEASADPLAAWLDRPELARAGRIADDLASLHGPDWSEEIALLPAAEAYAHELRSAAPDRPDVLIAHAWVRYLGDVSGGQVLLRLVERYYGAGPGSGGDAWAFPGLGDLETFKDEFRARLDALPEERAGPIVDTARRGFERSIALMDEVTSD